MRFSRRGLFGLLGGAAASPMLKTMPKMQVAQDITLRTIEPFAVGDVVPFGGKRFRVVNQTAYPVTLNA